MQCSGFKSCQTQNLVPVAIADVFNRLFAKTVVHVCGDEAKEACGTDQLCGGLEAGIEGCTHAMRTTWDLKNDPPEWGFFLLDAANAFNNGSRVVMTWNVRHEWPSGCRFVFNLCKHWSVLTVRNGDRALVTTQSREGVRQGLSLIHI